MVSKKVIIGAVVVIVAIIAIAAVASGGGDKSPDARYNYDSELTDFFMTSTGTIQSASDGYQYLIVTYTVYNDKISDGISTNSMMWSWKATANGVSYSSTVVGYLHPDYQLVTVEKGGHATSVEVFEVPATLTLSDITVSQNYTDFSNSKVERDESIIV